MRVYENLYIQKLSIKGDEKMYSDDYKEIPNNMKYIWNETHCVYMESRDHFYHNKLIKRSETSQQYYKAPVTERALMTIKPFVENCCFSYYQDIKFPITRIKVDDTEVWNVSQIYEVYVDFCTKTNRIPMSRTSFTTEFEKYAFRDKAIPNMYIFDKIADVKSSKGTMYRRKVRHYWNLHLRRYEE